MKRESYYISQQKLLSISDLNCDIEFQSCRQIELVDSQNLSRLSNENKSSNFKGKDIYQLWQLGFLNADIVYSDQELDIDGIVFLDRKDDVFLYADRRKLEFREKGYCDSIKDLANLPPNIELVFHPFRCFILYHLNRILKMGIGAMQKLLYSEGLNELISLDIKQFNEWSSQEETCLLFEYWNAITSLAIVSEPLCHSTIFNKTTIRSPLDSFSGLVQRLEQLSPKLKSIYLDLGEDAIEYYRRELCQDAEVVDPNKDLHLIIRLMRSDERAKLKGHIALSNLFLTMAECLRRNSETFFQKDFPEEDECGFGQITHDYKTITQGSYRLLDGKKIVANQFLRRFGLDFGIRVNVYVEGDTEFEALNSIFSTNSSVMLINLKGNFVEKKGKGVAFRESLRNDIKAKIFSMIVFDGDVSNNFKAVKKAAEDDEICGMYFVSNPDFEFQNFDHRELSQIAHELSRNLGLTIPPVDNFVSATSNANNGKSFFKALNALSDNIFLISKGKLWGESLVRYAMKHYKGDRFGDEKDRPLNRIIQIVSRCSHVQYENTRQKYRVNSATGELILREKLDQV